METFDPKELSTQESGDPTAAALRPLFAKELRRNLERLAPAGATTADLTRVCSRIADASLTFGFRHLADYVRRCAVLLRSGRFDANRLVAELEQVQQCIAGEDAHSVVPSRAEFTVVDPIAPQ